MDHRQRAECGRRLQIQHGFFRNLVYSNPDWDIKNFDLDRDLMAAQEKTAKALDAVNPDLRPSRRTAAS